MKCHIIWHFIRVFTICYFKQKRSSDKEIQFFFLNYNLTPLDYVQWTIPSLLYQTRRKNPSIYKGLRACLLIRLKAVLSLAAINKVKVAVLCPVQVFRSAWASKSLDYQPEETLSQLHIASVHKQRIITVYGLRIWPSSKGDMPLLIILSAIWEGSQDVANLAD